MIELLGDLIEWIGDLFDGGDVIDSVVDGGAAVIGTAFDVISTALLIQGVLYVASLTVDSIRSELNNRRELKAKGVTNVVIQDFINQSGYTEISLARSTTFCLALSEVYGGAWKYVALIPTPRFEIM